MRRSVLLALLLLALAGGLRLWASSHARFTGDESDYWAKSRKVATGQFVPIYGPEITGSAAKLPGPAYYYLMAAPQALSASPYAGSTFVVLLHLLAGWLLFQLGARARSDRAGLIALALFAFGPWDVLYADRIWGSCVVPAWGALTFYAAYRSRDSKAWQGALLFLSLVLPQLHLSVPVLWLACLALLVLRPPKQVGWRALAIGLALTVLAYGPPLIAELGSGFANSRTILAKGGGTEPLAYALWNPVRVLGYAVLYGSGEIGYHFARGYWGGGFDDFAAYLTIGGWRRFFELHGAGLAAMGVISVLLSLLAWMGTLAGVAKEGLAALGARARDRISLDRALSLALLIGFLGGGLLLLLAKKRFFPHYANILMPIALWPIASAIDRAWDHRRARIPLGLALAASLGFMLTSTVRYYREVDTLNGLQNTLDMVEAVLEDGTPSRVDFTHFRNQYAWTMVADVLHGRPIPQDPSGRVRWRVDNRGPHRGEVPEGGRLFGPVLMRRIPPTGGGANPMSATVKGWRDFDVEVVRADGTRRGCRPEATRCRYGDHPWQRFGPQTMQIGGAPRPLLFMHPVAGATVQARRALPAGTRQVDLHYALDDAACRSDNQAPVEVTLLDGQAQLGAASAGNRPGLHRATFTRGSTAAGSLTVQIRTENEGARVFGFDLELK